MYRNTIHLICLIAFVLATAGCSNKALLKQKDLEITQLNSNVQEIKDEVGRLEKDITAQKEMNDALERTVADLREKRQVLMEERKSLTHISLAGSANFASGSAVLNDEAKQVLDRIGHVLKDYADRWVLIEGHTDDQPIHPAYRWKYSSNWELSTARSTAVLHYLLDNFDIDPGRVMAVGLGPYHPRQAGSDLESREMNRRVVFTIGGEMAVVKRLTAGR